MKFLFKIVVTLIFISCSNTGNLTNEQIAGKFQWNDIYGVSSTIYLKLDKTFEYHWQTGLMGGTTIGKWKRDGVKIILNSNLQPAENRNEDFEIIEIERKKSDSLYIKVVGPDNESVPYANCILKTEASNLTGAITNLNGEAKFPILNADSLIVSFVGLKTVRQSLDPSISSYIFKMAGELQNYHYFTNETWTFKKGRLYDPSIKKGKYVKNKYYNRIK